MTRDPDEVSVPWLIKSIARNTLDALRRNKLATVLTAVTATSLIVFAVNSRFYGLHQYQDFILPRLLRLETGFLKSLRMAESTSGEWRAYYVKDAHSQVRDILRAARLELPKAYLARGKHHQFIRYYESLDSTFHSIEMQMSVNPDLDDLRQLREKMDELKPIRDGWFEWARQGERPASQVE